MSILAPAVEEARNHSSVSDRTALPGSTRLPLKLRDTPGGIPAQSRPPHQRSGKSSLMLALPQSLTINDGGDRAVCGSLLFFLAWMTAIKPTTWAPLPFSPSPVRLPRIPQCHAGHAQLWRINQPGQSSPESNGTSRQNGKNLIVNCVPSYHTNVLTPIWRVTRPGEEAIASIFASW